MLQNGMYFPNDFVLNLSKDLKLLSIPGAVLNGEQFMQLKKLAENTANIFRWLDNERRQAYPGITKVVEDS
jgi:DNA mismatch repair protein MutS2